MATLSERENLERKRPFAYITPPADDEDEAPKDSAVKSPIRKQQNPWGEYQGVPSLGSAQERHSIRWVSRTDTRLVGETAKRLRRFSDSKPDRKWMKIARVIDVRQNRTPKTGSNDTRIITIQNQKSPYRPLLPSLNLYKGNSDPFDSLSINIDPRANEIMSFFRKYVVPQLFPSGKMQSERRSGAIKRHLLTHNGYMEDPGTAYAFLGYYANVINLVFPDAQLPKQSLIYKAKALSILRARISSDTQALENEICWQLNMLQTSETLTGNRNAAHTYGMMLRSMLEHSDNISLPILNYCLHGDIQSSVTFLARTHLDVDSWIPDRLSPTWTAARNSLQLSPANDLSIDPSVTSDTIKAILLEKREHTRAMQLAAGYKDGHYGLGAAVGVWLVTQNFVHQGRLVNTYLEYRDQLRLQGFGSSRPHLDEIYAQAALALATLLTMREGSGHIKVAGRPVFDVIATILRELRSILTQSRSPRNVVYRNGRLWALYIGAQVEQAQLANSKSDSAARSWFNARLAALARQMGLFSWQQVCKVFQGFLYSDRAKPHGSEWFWKTMSASLEHEQVLIGHGSMD